MVLRNSHKLTFMFFTPHSDDIELGTPCLFLNALRRGHKVIEVIMTNNEMGTIQREFKGMRLRKIREWEQKRANQVFCEGLNNRVQEIRMNYIDGYLPLNKDSVKKTVDLIREVHPDIIITCDPWYAQDFHADHLNTGRLVFFALIHLSESERPKKVLYYYSTSTDYYIPCKWKDINVAEKALLDHKSQYSPFDVKIIMHLYNRLSIFRHLIEKAQVSESFRLQNFKNGRPVFPEKYDQMNIYKRIIYMQFSNVTIWGSRELHDVSLEELGLKADYNMYDLLRLKDPRYKFKGDPNQKRKTIYKKI